MDDKIEWPNIEDVKCPICDGPINCKWFEGMREDTAIFVAECWPGTSEDNSPRHIFSFQIKMPARVVVARKERES